MKIEVYRPVQKHKEVLSKFTIIHKETEIGTILKHTSASKISKYPTNATSAWIS